MNESEFTFRLDGKVAVLTGGASGIGAGIARALAQAGAHVVIADIDLQGAERQVGLLKEDGLSAAAIALNLADEDAIIAACTDIVDAYGTPWILVNNAGLQDREALLGGSAAHWERMHQINSRGPFFMTRELAKAMAAAGQGGRIVNIASAALRGSIVKGLAAYTASKGALLGLSQASAFELIEHGITVNTVLPGGVATPGAIAATGPVPEGPARRPPPLGMCAAEDIASAVVYFASPAARRVTNQVLAVDGGFSVS